MRPPAPFRLHFVQWHPLLSWLVVAALLALTGCTSAPGGGGGGGGACPAGDLHLGLSYPPVGDAFQREITRQHMAALGLDRLRFSEHWALREPTPGALDWDPLDAAIGFVVDQGYSLMLTIESNGPGWACDGTQTNAQSCVYADEGAFASYVGALMARYAGQIDRIQFGNEWQSTWWYAGSAESFVRANNIVYDAAKQYSPGTEVVLGGFSIGALQGMAACFGRIDELVIAESPGQVQHISGPELDAFCASSEAKAFDQRVRQVLDHAHFDRVDLHLYDDAEHWPAYLAVLTSPPLGPLASPLVSEFGGPNSFIEPDDDAYHAGRLQVYLETLEGMGVSDAYYFKLVEGTTDNPAHQHSGLLRLLPDDTLEQKPGYAVFQQHSSCAAGGGA